MGFLTHNNELGHKNLEHHHVLVGLACWSTFQPNHLCFQFLSSLFVPYKRIIVYGNENHTEQWHCARSQYESQF